MPTLWEDEKESPLYAGRGGDQNGPLHPQVSNELQDAIQNRNVANVPRLKAFCDHVASDDVLEEFKRWKQYWANRKGDWELFVKSQAQEAIDVIATAIVGDVGRRRLRRGQTVVATPATVVLVAS